MERGPSTVPAQSFNEILDWKRKNRTVISNIGNNQRTSKENESKIEGERKNDFSFACFYFQTMMEIFLMECFQIGIIMIYQKKI